MPGSSVLKGARTTTAKRLAAARWYARLLSDTRGWRSRGAVARWIIARRIAPSSLARYANRVEAQIGPFDLAFSAEDEILPYWQIEADIRAEVIPLGGGTHDWTVVDCGANIGLFSLFLGSAHRLLAIEPNPHCCTVLSRNLEANGVEATVIQCAVSARPGRVRMTFGERSSVFAQIADHGESEVDALTLDDVLAEFGIDEVHLLKLDLEGHELEALRGAGQALAQRRIRRIYTEFHSRQALAQLDEYLTPHGFVRACTGSLNARYDI